MRILYVIENMEYGGGERCFELIIKKINKEKFNIYIACFNDGILVERIKNMVKVLHLDLRKRINIKNILYLKDIIINNKIDIVHSQGARADFYARIAAKIARVPIVSSVTMPVEGFDVSFFKKQVYIFFDRLTEKFVNKFLVCSKFLFKQLSEKHKIPREKIEFIPNGVDLKNYFYSSEKNNQIRNELGIENNTILIGSIGRLVWQKGLDYLIDAVLVLKKSLDKEIFDKIKFIIVGEGEEKGRLIKKTKMLNIDNKIIFTGFRENIGEIFDALDIFVLSSVLEGQPFVLLEAMAYGKPIVATNISGVNETVFNNETSIMVKPYDAKSLAKGIEVLLKNKQKAVSLGDKAKKYVQKFYDFNVLIKQYENVYEKLYMLNKKVLEK